MKLLTLTLFTLLSLVIEIAANNESIGSEVLYFYYVYKMQYSSGGDRTIATGCGPSGSVGMCYFDDFVKYIMERDFVQGYRPSPSDHTKTPSQSNLVTFKKSITQQSVSYRMDRLDTRLQNAASGDVAGAARSQAALIETMLGSANNAIDSGNVLISDAESAHEAIEDAIQKRSPQAMDAVDSWLARQLTEEEQGHISKNGAIVDWKETLDNIDLAVEDDDLTHDEGEALKTKMTNISGQFGQDEVDVPRSEITHMSILRALQDSSTQIKAGIDRGDEEVDDKIPAPAESASSCSSDYESSSESSSSGSELKRRVTHGFVAKLFKFAKRQPGALAKILEARQLQPISVSKVGVTASSSTSSATPVSKSTHSVLSSSSPSSTLTLLPSTASSEAVVNTKTGYDMAVTTVFSAPPECTGGITTMATDTGNLWLNVIDPVPTVTMTQCYPSQFVASALAKTTLPPFSKLVCPDHWESYKANSTYVVCCPQGYSLWAPHWTETARPGRNAYCSSVIWPSVIMDVTSYDTSALVTVLPETAGTDGNIVFATAFDGNTYAPTTPASSSLLVTFSSKSSQVTVSSSLLSIKSSTLPFSSPATSTASTGATSVTSSISSKPSSTLSVVVKTSSIVPTTSPTKTSSSTTKASTALPAISSLPSCGQTCMNNMLSQYSTLGCSSADPACVCRNPNFGYGVRDCSNGACGSSVGASVITWASNYCSIAEASKTTQPSTATPTPTATGIGSLPSCGQTCMNNMIAQYSSLGCSSSQAACLCKNANFGYGIRDCANGACGTAVASTVISFGSAYCARATAAA